MKNLLPLLALATLLLTSCNTLSNRRSLYYSKKVEGPYTELYTKMIHRGADWAKPLPPKEVVVLKTETVALPAL